MGRSLSLLILVSFVSQFALAENLRCESVLNTGIIREFLPQKKQKNVQLIEVDHKLPVQNQGNRGVCWEYSTLTGLINRSILRTGQNPKISFFYDAFYHWRESAIQTALEGKDSRPQEGGSMGRAVSLFRKYGVLTEDEWTALGGSTTTQLPENDLKEIPQLTTLISKIHIERDAFRKWLKQDIPSSASLEQRTAYNVQVIGDPFTGIALRDFLNEKEHDLKAGKQSAYTIETIQELKKMLKDQVPPGEVLPQSTLDELVLAFNNDSTLRVVRFFNQMYFGTEEDRLAKVDLKVARERAMTLFPEIAQPVIYFAISRDAKVPLEVASVTDGGYRIVMPIDQVVRVAKALIQSNIPVTLSYDHQKNFVNALDKEHPEDSGLMSIRRLLEKPESSYLTRRQRSNPSSAYVRSGHLVQLEGVYLRTDATPEQVARGKDVLSFKMQNSWGIKYGQRGFFTMDRDFFGGFADVIGLFPTDLAKPAVVEALGADNVRLILTQISKIQKAKKTAAAAKAPVK